jgi:PAS domain S-box-containing protein
MEQLADFENIVIQDVSTLPTEAHAEKAFLEAQDIESAIVVPMAIEGTLLGFIGFDWLDTQASWSTEFINALTTAGVLISNSLDRRERERELRETRRRFELAVDGASLGIWDWHVPTDEVSWNDQWMTILGEDPAAVDPTFDFWRDRLHPDDAAAVLSGIEAHLAGETPQFESEHRLRTADDEWLWVRDVGQVVEWTDEGEPARAVGLTQDIDDRKRAETTVETANDRLRQVIDLVPDLVFVKNRQGKYLLANEATAAAYGYSPEEVEGQTEAELIPDLDESESFREDDLAVIESGEPRFIAEEELTTADGETRILETTKIPFEPAGTDQDAVLGYARDITELKNYERTLESQRDNLDVLNQIVRHDIRNDLQLVVAYADMVREDLDGQAADYLDQVLNAARDAIEITMTAGDVTEVMLQDGVDQQPVRLRPTLQSEIDAARSTHESALIRTDGPIPDVRVRADEMLESVFRNLLQNAVAHNDTDLPQVAVSATVDADTVSVEIADNGPGIPDARKEEIFEEGAQGLESSGTGLGLYLVQTLVERYGGDVSVRDRTGGWPVEGPDVDADEREGAVFVVELPLVE